MDVQEKNLITRREALKRAALVFGGVLSTPAALSILSGCTPTRTSATGFTEEERAVIEAISDIIIPATDTPGATEAGAVQLAEDMLFGVTGEEERNDFLEKLSGFQKEAASELGVSFQNATAEQQTEYITRLHDEVFGGDTVDWSEPKPFIWQIKEGIVNSYFATEVGMTQVQQYVQTPGRLEYCISFEEAGEGNRVWSW